MKKLIIYILPIIFVFLTCNKTTEIIPCEGIKPFTAEFKMYHTLQYDAGTLLSDYDTDTICTYNPYYTSNIVAFKCDEIKARYLWQIGSGIYTAAGFSLDFRDYTQKNHLITLQVTKDNKSICFPNDSGTRVFSRNLVFTNKSKIFGKYRGKFDYLPEKEVTIVIDTIFDTSPLIRNNDGNFSFMYITNYPFENDTIFFPKDEMTLTYKSFASNLGFDAYINIPTQKCRNTSSGFTTAINQECNVIWYKRPINWRVQIVMEVNEKNDILITGKHFVKTGQKEINRLFDFDKLHDFTFVGTKI